MDAEITLLERSQWAANKEEQKATARETRPLNTHHFVLYGQANRYDAAAFAAGKVFLESAIGAVLRETDGRAAKTDPKLITEGRHYVVRFPTKGRIGAYGSDLRHNADRAKSKLEFTVDLAPNQSGNILAAVGYKDRPERGIVYFTAVNRGIIHCIRALSGKSGMAHR